QTSNYLFLGRFCNGQGWAYSELYDFKKAYSFNKLSLENVNTLRKSPAIIYWALEMQAMAEVNLMENKFEMGQVDEAWEHLTRFEEVSAHPDYAWTRDRWLTRMNDLKGTILLDREDIDSAEELARQCLDAAAKRGWKKYVGKAERLLGRTFTTRGAFDQAEEHMQTALAKLEEVGNPKQRWITHMALARLYKKMNRPDLEREQWQAARAVIQATADGLEDQDLRQIFINAAPVQEIMEHAAR
ncbi:hypothetical protein LCGC14_2264560, partial [marine sediment metagenome]